VRVRIWAENFRRGYRQGEEIRFKVDVDRSAYVYLFDVRPDGKTVMIFPNAYHPDNLIKAGEAVTLPSAAMRFRFIIEEPFGPEAVQAVATTSRLASTEIQTRGGFSTSGDLGHPFTDISAGTRGLAEAIREVRTRGIGVVPNEAPPGWAENHWVFVTER
jgi:hypothetical protein